MRRFFSQVPVQSVHRVQVFTNSPQKGNPAAVVRGFKGESDEMQRIAADFDLPATVFILPATSENAAHALRFFTPKGELSMCGHGALAAGYILFRENRQKEIVLEVKGKPLTLFNKENGLVSLTMSHAKSYSTELPEHQIFNLLGLAKNDLAPDLPFCMAGNGLNFLLIPLKDRQKLLNLSLDQKGILDFTEKNNLAAFYVYTPDTIAPNATYHARCFNPRFNPSFEDVATGAAAAALGSVHAQSNEHSGNTIIEQGAILKKPSEIYTFAGPMNIEIGGHLALGVLDLNGFENSKKTLGFH